MINDDRQLTEEPAGYSAKATDEIVALISEYKMIQARQKEDKQRLQDIQHLVECHMGDSEQLVTDDGELILTYKYAKEGVRFDSKAFEKAYPRLYEDFLFASAGSRRFLPK